MTTKLRDGQVLIHNKVYDTVALRVQRFREKHPMFTLLTEAIQRDEACVVMKASILNEEGRVIATGHAEEYRSSSQINKTSALENAETSAIGRCLAAFGLGGTEFASADEVAHAITGKPPAPPASAQGVKEDALAKLPSPRRNIVVDTATQTKDALKEGRDIDALGLAESLSDEQEIVALWGLLDAKERTRIKEASKAAQRLAEQKAAAKEWKEAVGAT